MSTLAIPAANKITRNRSVLTPDLLPSATLLCRFRGDTGFTPGTGVWTDMQGNGNTTPQAAVFPSASTINGKTSCLFPGSANQGLLIPSKSLDSFTIAAVIKDAAAGYVCVHITDAGTTGGYLYTDTSTTNYYARASTVSDKRFAVGLKDGLPRLVVWTFGGSTATNILHLGRSTVTEVTTTGNNPGAGPTAGIIYLGASQAGGGVSALNLGEFMVWNAVLTAADINALADYSLGYWGV